MYHRIVFPTLSTFALLSIWGIKSSKLVILQQSLSQRVILTEIVFYGKQTQYAAEKKWRKLSNVTILHRSFKHRQSW